VQPLIKSPFAKGIDGGLLISDSDLFGALLLTILLVALQALALQVAEPCNAASLTAPNNAAICDKVIQLRLDGAPAPLSDGAALYVHLPAMLEVILSGLLNSGTEDALARVEIGFDSEEFVFRSLYSCIQVLGFQRLANVLTFFANPHAKVPVPAALLGSDDFCFSAVDRVLVR